jgi:hypothetical protein
MKNFLILSFALLLVGCNSKNAATIEAVTTGLPDSTQVYLCGLDFSAPLDTVPVVDGKFTLWIKKLYPAFPDYLFLRFEGWQGGIPLFVEPGDILITCNFNPGDRTLQPRDFTVTGTPTNDLYTDYLRGQQREAILARTASLRSEFLGAQEDITRDSLSSLLDEQQKQRDQLREEFIAANPLSIAATHLRYAMISPTDGYTAGQIDSLLNLFPAELPQNSFVDKLKAQRDALQ